MLGSGAHLGLPDGGLELGRERLWWLSLEAGRRTRRWVERLQAPWPPPVGTVPPRTAQAVARIVQQAVGAVLPARVWGLFRQPTITREPLQLPCRCSHRLGAGGPKVCAPVCRLGGAPSCGGRKPHVGCRSASSSLLQPRQHGRQYRHGCSLPLVWQVWPFGRAVFSQCTGHSFAQNWHLNLGGLSAQCGKQLYNVCCIQSAFTVQVADATPASSVPTHGRWHADTSSPRYPMHSQKGLLYRQWKTRLDMRECSSNGGLQLPRSRQKAARRW